MSEQKRMAMGDVVVVSQEGQPDFEGRVSHYDATQFHVTRDASAAGPQAARVYAHGTVRVRLLRRG